MSQDEDEQRLPIRTTSKEAVCLLLLHPISPQNENNPPELSNKEITYAIDALGGLNRGVIGSKVRHHHGDR